MVVIEEDNRVPQGKGGRTKEGRQRVPVCLIPRRFKKEKKTSVQQERKERSPNARKQGRSVNDPGGNIQLKILRRVRVCE